MLRAPVVHDALPWCRASQGGPGLGLNVDCGLQCERIFLRSY